MTRLKITHLISSLQAGGVEHVLLGLLGRTDPTWCESNVVTLLAEGPLAAPIRSLGVEVQSLGVRSGTSLPRAGLRLAQSLRRERPDLLVAWMYHANLVSAFCKAFQPRLPVLWNIHNSRMDAGARKPLTEAMLWAGGYLARWLPRHVVYCSYSAKRAHLSAGYGAANSIVIPNGFDVELFRPQPAARSSVRLELGIDAGAPLVGLCGRFHPQKDHRNFILAARDIKQQRPDVAFLICGAQADPSNRQLVQWIAEASLQSCCHLLGRRSDMPRLHASLDLLVSSSSCGEAFPLVIGEAMASGVPCVATDVGDSAQLIDEAAQIVPPRDPQRLAGACLAILNLPSTARRALGSAARQRIVTHYPLDRIAQSYFDLWRRTARPGKPGQPAIDGKDSSARTSRLPMGANFAPSDCYETSNDRAA